MAKKKIVPTGEVNPAETPKLSVLRKAQIIAGFEMAAPYGSQQTDEYNGDFLLAGAMESDTKKVQAFLEAEGAHPTLTAPVGKGVAKVTLSAAEYYRLEKLYTIPLEPKAVKDMLKKFTPTHLTAQFTNHNSAYGANFTRAMKLLRDNNIPFTCSTDGAKGMGDEIHEGSITLTSGTFDTLQKNMDTILNAEKKRYDDHQDATRESAARKPSAA